MVSLYTTSGGKERVCAENMRICPRAYDYIYAVAAGKCTILTLESIRSLVDNVPEIQRRPAVGC